MKKNFILIFLVLCCQSIVFAIAPTVPSSNLKFSNIDGSQFSGSFDIGNGVNRIIVMREGAPVEGKPVDGKDYVANSVFGTAGSEFTSPGEYVIAKTSWGSFSVSKLNPGTLYYIAVFEYNGMGTATQYLQVPLTGSQSTVIAPTVPVSSVSAAAVIGNALTLNWISGNGSGRMVIARKGAPVNVTPVDLTLYFSDPALGSGTKLGTDNYVVFKGTGNAAAVKNLEPNTIYYFSIFEYNGNATPVFLKPGIAFSTTTNTGPTTAPSAPGFSYVEGNRMTIGVAAGNGNRRLFIARKGAPVTSVPQNGIAYTANAAFGTAGTTIADDEFVVGVTAGTAVAVTNLEPNTVYHFRVFEYDVDNAGNTYYYTGGSASKSGSTATTPTAPPTNLNIVSLTGNSATINFTAGNGNYRIAVMKAGSAVDGAPADLLKYTPNNNFGSGAETKTGNYCIAWGFNGSQFNVAGLQPGVTYYVAVYEFNGYDAPVYSKTAGTYSFTVPLEPVVPSKNMSTLLAESRSLRLVWTNGDGARRIVVAKKGSPVTGKPLDNKTYIANDNFGMGETLGAGEYVVYDNNSNYVDLKNLEVSTTYYIAVFEYNAGSDNKPDYLTSSWLSATTSTITWPTTQTVISGVSSLTANQATINFTKGNGASRIFVMKQGSAVSAQPQDFSKYSYSGAFGTAGSLLSDGNYIVNITGGTGSFIVSNLQPATTYFINAFEFNGSAEPAYLRTSPASWSFTTPDVPGATTPTTAAVNATVSNVDGNKLTLQWSNGNGEKRIVVMRKGIPVDFLPVAGTAYTANAAMGSSTDLGGGQYVLFNASGNKVDITNLEPSATYYFTIFEYNGTGSLIRYLTSSVLSGSAATSMAPSVPATVTAMQTGATDITLTWNKGNGEGRLVIVKQGAAVTGKPADLSAYPANAVFKSGAQVAAGEYVVYAGTGTTVKITGLTAYTTYYYSIIEYNGTAAPVYNATMAVTGTTITSAPLPVKLLSFTARATGTGIQLNWATAQEVNNAFFTVERSVDGVRFESIATVAGAGNSNQVIQYAYTDVSATGNKVYYRLTQTDIDGNFTRSVVQVLHLEDKEQQISIFPNPVQNQFKVVLPNGVKEAVLSIFDAKGMLLQQQRITGGQYINSTALRTGIYYITLRTAEKLYRGTLLKQ